MSNIAKSISPILGVASMVSPQTAWLAKAAKIAGGLGAYGDAQRAGNMAGALNGMTFDDLKRQGMLNKMAFDTYNKNLDSGLYDPEKRIAKLYDSFKVGTDYGAKGLTNSLLNQGYKPGDTAATQNVDHYLGGRAADFALKADALRRDVASQQYEDMMRAAGVGNPLQTAGLASGIAGNYSAAASSAIPSLVDAFKSFMPAPREQQGVVTPSKDLNPGPGPGNYENINYGPQSRGVALGDQSSDIPQTQVLDRPKGKTIKVFARGG